MPPNFQPKFPLMRRVFPQLIAQQLCAVQPMTQPVGGVIFYKSRYGVPELKIGDTVEGSHNCPVMNFSGVVISIDDLTTENRDIVVECVRTGLRYLMERKHVVKVSLLEALANAAVGEGA